MLTNRYARQAKLPQIGEAGQMLLRQAKVLIVGCGALGSVQAELLARAGVGFLRIVDRDIPEASNLPRQFLYDEATVEQCIPKAIAAKERLAQINSECQVEAVVQDVHGENLPRLAQGMDLILDGVDNFFTRYLLNDFCVKQGIPWVYGAIQGTQVLAMPILPQHACLRCVFPDPPVIGSVPTCEISGVLNASPAIAASLQVAQAVRILVQEKFTPQFVVIDPWTFESRSLKMSRDPQCLCCGQQQFEFLNHAKPQAVQLCGRNSIQVNPLQDLALDLKDWSEKLRDIAKCQLRREVLEVHYAELRLVVFRDGRVVVHGTADEGLARNLVGKLFGF